MKMSTLSSLLVLMSVVSMIAIAPSAFAMGHAATVTNAPGSATPGCEETDDCFIPSTVTIHPGGTVTFDNTDNAAHTATGGSPTDGPSGAFDTSLIMAGGSATITFDDEGTYPYFCMVHPWMQGTVVVAAEAEEEHVEEHTPEPEVSGAPVAEQAASDVAPTMSVGSPTMSSGDGPGDMIDQLDWTISNGDVKSMYLSAEHSSLIIHTETTDDGELFVGLNADYIGSDDGTFVILVDNQEHQDYEQAGMDFYIDLPAGAETVEIIGSYAVPEFGTIAMIILAVAIVSIIAITAKTRTTLIPKL